MSEIFGGFDEIRGEEFFRDGERDGLLWLVYPKPIDIRGGRFIVPDRGALVLEFVPRRCSDTIGTGHVVIYEKRPGKSDPNISALIDIGANHPVRGDEEEILPYFLIFVEPTGTDDKERLVFRFVDGERFGLAALRRHDGFARFAVDAAENNGEHYISFWRENQ